MKTSRRAFLERFSSLGAGSFLLPPLALWANEALGIDPAPRNPLLVLTFGNGWAHQGADHRNGATLDTVVRSETDWDLPTNLEALRAYKQRLSIVRKLTNPFSARLHGSGWSTLTVQKTDGRLPGGLSIDRAIAKATGASDPFTSLALGISHKPGIPAACASADGLNRPFPAVSSPLQAFDMLFGSDGLASIDGELALTNAALSQAREVRKKLAGPEAVKLDQYLSSIDEVARQLTGRKTTIAARGVPPKLTLTYKPGLEREVMQGHFEIARLALTFGFTRVVHISLLGFNDHNAGWNSLGFPGDAHEYVAHAAAGKEYATNCFNAVVQFQAQELARLLSGLSQSTEGGQPLSDRLSVLWLNSAGGKHHDGANFHPVVLLNHAASKLRSNVYIELEQRRPISELFLSVAQSVGAPLTTFGDPAYCDGPLGVLKT
jgi:hypothetical protein